MRAWHPLTPSWAPLLAVLFGVCVLPETHSFGFVLCALLGLTVDTVHVSVFGGFWLLFHTFPFEGGLRILRSILGQTHGFPVSPSYSAAIGLVSLPCEVYRKPWIYWEMTSGIFRIAGMLRVSFGRRLAPVAWQHGRLEQKDSITVVMAVAFARLVLLVPLLALFFLCRCQALMLCIMVGMDPPDEKQALREMRRF